MYVAHCGFACMGVRDTGSLSAGLISAGLNWQELSGLSAVCDRSHGHAHWGRLKRCVWATAEDAAYPRLLYARYLQQLLTSLLSKGTVSPPMVRDATGLSLVPNQALAVSSITNPEVVAIRLL